MPPFVLAVVAFCGAFLVLRFSFPYLAPFFLGLTLALIMDVPVSYLESKGWPRPLMSFIFVSIAFLTLPVATTLFLLQLWGEIQELQYLSSILSQNVPEFYGMIPLLDTGLGIQTLFKWALAIPDFFLVWTFTIFSAYFFCRDKEVLTKFFAQHLPKRKGFSIRQVYSDTSGALWYFIQVQLLLMLISTGVSMVLFALLELPYALLSGFLVGFFDLWPILGPGLVYFSLAVIQFWLGNTSTALALGLGYLILLLLRQWGEPYLVSEKLGLHPLLALVGLYAGFRFWGPLGAVIGPILMVFIKAFMVSYSFKS